MKKNKIEKRGYKYCKKYWYWDSFMSRCKILPCSKICRRNWHFFHTFSVLASVNIELCLLEKYLTFKSRHKYWYINNYYLKQLNFESESKIMMIVNWDMNLLSCNSCGFLSGHCISSPHFWFYTSCLVLKQKDNECFYYEYIYLVYTVIISISVNLPLQWWMEVYQTEQFPIIGN